MSSNDKGSKEELVYNREVKTEKWIQWKKWWNLDPSILTSSSTLTKVLSISELFDASAKSEKRDDGIKKWSKSRLQIFHLHILSILQAPICTNNQQLVMKIPAQRIFLLHFLKLRIFPYSTYFFL